MSILTRKQIMSRLNNGQLLRAPRKRDDGQFDVEADSYDLSAGTAIWKQSAESGKSGCIRTEIYRPDLSGAEQATVTVWPGQMIFVVTREDILMPPDLCGTVYSRNNLALKGILALNAGHVDSGYEGPIAIRLINLRATPWTLNLGDPIFTITFQTMDADPGDVSGFVRRISQEEMILRVRDTADAALSNALYDLYASEVEKRLNEYQYKALAQFLQEGDKRWVQTDRLLTTLLSFLWKMSVALIIFAATVAAGIAGVLYAVEFFREHF